MTIKIVNPDDVDEAHYGALDEAALQNIELWEDEDAGQRGYRFFCGGKLYRKIFSCSRAYNDIAQEALDELESLQLEASGYENLL